MLYSRKDFSCFNFWDHLRIVIDKRTQARAVQLFSWFPLPGVTVTVLFCIFILWFFGGIMGDSDLLFETSTCLWPLHRG